MEGFRDRADDALRKAAVPTLDRIRKDGKIAGLPEQVRRLLAHFEAKLFDRRLNVNSARSDLEIRDHSVSTEFRSWLGCTPVQYIRIRRLETAARMLGATDLGERRISRTVGFTSYDTFYKGYKAWAGKAPSKGRDDPVPEIDLPAWHRVYRGELTPEEAEQLIDELRRVYPAADPDPPRREDEAPPRTVIDGAGYERFQATELWRRIRALPGDEQKREVKGYLFHSTVLFDLLRTKSREEGRKDRECGVQLAELALVSLEGHEEIFGARVHDLRALGWAWLANARCLALDFDGSDADYVRGDREWSVPRAEKDLTILAQVRLLKGGLRMFQRRYSEALELLDESVRLSQLEGNAAVQAEALIQRASVKGYMERLGETAADLQYSATLIESQHEPYLAYMISLNQANAQIRLGNHDSGAASLTEAATCCKQLDNELGWFEIQHLEGNLSERVGDSISAEKSFVDALEGFIRSNEMRSAVFVALDLAILYSRQGIRRRVLDLAAWTIPVLQSMKLHHETLAAIEVLASESEAMRVDQSLLCKVAKLLELDPLVRLSQRRRAGGVSRPSCLRH